MNISEALILVVGGLMITFIVGATCMLFVIAIDSISLEDIGEESVPCIDEKNRPFEDEMCIKTITCSNWGLAGDKKCANVLLDETGGEE